MSDIVIREYHAQLRNALLLEPSDMGNFVSVFDEVLYLYDPKLQEKWQQINLNEIAGKIYDWTDPPKTDSKNTRKLYTMMVKFSEDNKLKDLAKMLKANPYWKALQGRKVVRIASFSIFSILLISLLNPYRR